MSIQSEINFSISETGGKLKTVTLKNQDGAAIVPDDIVLNLTDCDPAALTLGVRNTLNITNGTMTGALTTATDGQCQVMLYNVTIMANLVFNNALVEIVNCDLDGSQITLANGSRAVVVDSTIDHTGGGVAVFVVTGNSHVEVYDTPVNGNGDCLDLTGSTAQLANSPVTSIAGKGVDLDAGSHIDVVDSNISGGTDGIEVTVESSATVAGSTVAGNPAIDLNTGSTLTLIGKASGDTINVANAAITVAGNSAIDILGANSIKCSSGVFLDLVGSSRAVVTNVGTLEGATSAVKCAGGSSCQISGYTTINATAGDALDVDGGQICAVNGGAITASGGDAADVSGGELLVDTGTTLGTVNCTGGIFKVSRITTCGNLTISGGQAIINDISNAITDVDFDNTKIAASDVTFTTMDADSTNLGFYNVTVTNSTTITGGHSQMIDSTTGAIALATAAALILRSCSVGVVTGFDQEISAGSFISYG